MKRYAVPVEVNPVTLKAAAERRRAALTTAGCSTYSLGVRNGETSIVCLCCGLGSSSVEDVNHRYCGFCREFHSEETGHV